jgi:hypothetical protein
MQNMQNMQNTKHKTQREVFQNGAAKRGHFTENDKQ